MSVEKARLSLAIYKRQEEEGRKGGEEEGRRRDFFLEFSNPLSSSIKFCCNAWFGNFLRNRQQRVVVRDTFFLWTYVSSGVPQATILGAILFLIYVNDVSSDISSPIKMFTDDTKVNGEISLFVNDTLWQLRFNSEKCN